MDIRFALNDSFLSALTTFPWLILLPLLVLLPWKIEKEWKAAGAFPLFLRNRYQPNFLTKSAIASETLICWGQTASQLRHPIQAPGRFSSWMADRAIGAIKPPSVTQCSLYNASKAGISKPWGQWPTQYRHAGTWQRNFFHHIIRDFKQFFHFFRI